MTSKLNLNALLILLTCIVLGACHGNNQQTSSGRNQTLSSTESNETTEANLPKVSVENMTEREAIEFVDTWKNIFATHTFDNYIKLYDPISFIGIKRTYTGQKNTYDYNGWVQNKRNEFHKYSPDVYLENVRVKWLNKEGLTKVSFLQIWVSTVNGNYADKGEKELILKKVNGEIYIVREELLYSQKYDEYFYEGD